VEGLHQVSGRVEAAVGVIVNQVDTASNVITSILSTVQRATVDLKKQADVSTRYALISLVVATIALAVSAVFGYRGYYADRREAVEQGLESRALLEATRAQNKLLDELVRRQRTAGLPEGPAREKPAVATSAAAAAPKGNPPSSGTSRQRRK
jgi:hypothetical protein